MSTPTDTPAPPRRAFYVALALVTLAALVLRLAIASRPIEALDGKSLPDDAYLSLELAKNIGQGKGPLYGDVLTNGFQPLYVFLMAIPFAFQSPESLLETETLDRMTNLALILCGTFDAASVAVFGLALYTAFGLPSVALIGAAIWATHPALLVAAMNGLETSIALFFLLLVWLLALRAPFATASPRNLVVQGLVMGVAMVARIDLIMAGIYHFASSLLLLAKRKTPDADWLRRNLTFGAAVLVGYSPWLAYSYFHTGLFFPVSGKAIRFMSLAGVDQKPDSAFYARQLAKAVDSLFDNDPILPLAALTCFTLLAIAATRLSDARRALKALALPLIVAIALFCAYCFYIFGSWFFVRYLLPLFVFGFAALLAVLALALARLPRPIAAGVAIMLAAAAVAHGLTDARTENLLVGAPDKRLGYRNLGLWAAKKFPPGTIIGSSQTGGLGYYAPRLNVVNLDGVVNQQVFRSLVEKRNLDYIREVGVQYVVGWKSNIRFIKIRSEGFREKDLRFIEEVKGFRSWNNKWLLYEVTYPDKSRP